jgi:RNA polymerase sigma-70 factor (ECF subfamily)
MEERLRAQLESLHAASFGFALACTGRDASAASDVLQEAYWKVLEGKARFEGRSALKTWFFGVIRITAMEQRRSIVRWFRRDDANASAEEVPASSGAKPDNALGRSEDAARVSRALAQLAPRQREVLHLVFYEELTIAEAAIIMNVSIGSARQHYDRGKKRIHEILSEAKR